MADELTYENVVTNLVHEVSDLCPLYGEHLRDYGELLPHVFFGDLTRFVIKAFEVSKNTKDMNTVRDVAISILSLLERAMASSDEKLQELVSVSFLENLDQAGEAYGCIRASLGPMLKKELEEKQSGRSCE